MTTAAVTACPYQHAQRMGASAALGPLRLNPSRQHPPAATQDRAANVGYRQSAR
jgi:hypothetical protein